MAANTGNVGRGTVATEDMRNRIAAGWDVAQLWDRYAAAALGDGFEYDFAEKLSDDAEMALTGSGLEV